MALIKRFRTREQITLARALSVDRSAQRLNAPPTYGACEIYINEYPLSRKFGTHKTVTARFWLWLEPFVR